MYKLGFLSNGSEFEFTFQLVRILTMFWHMGLSTASPVSAPNLISQNNLVHALYCFLDPIFWYDHASDLHFSEFVRFVRWWKNRGVRFLTVEKSVEFACCLVYLVL